VTADNEPSGLPRRWLFGGLQKSSSRLFKIGALARIWRLLRAAGPPSGTQSDYQRLLRELRIRNLTDFNRTEWTPSGLCSVRNCLSLHALGVEHYVVAVVKGK
jgi:hypothetical protein